MKILTNQDLINHVTMYFRNRIDHREGQCQSGWGSAVSPDERCALGTIVRESHSHICLMKSQLIRLLGLTHESLLLQPNTLTYEITRFNDHHATGKPQYALTDDVLNAKLVEWANKYNLKVDLRVPNEEIADYVF